MNSDSISSDTGTKDSPILCLDDDEEESTTKNIPNDLHDYKMTMLLLNTDDDDAAATAHRLGATHTRVAKMFDGKSREELHFGNVSHTEYSYAVLYDDNDREDLNPRGIYDARKLYEENKEADQIDRPTKAKEEERAAFEREAPRVAKMFDGELHYGNKLSKELWYHILYDDGVEEFLDAEEYNNARRLYRENKKADPKYRTTKAKEEERAEIRLRVKAQSEAKQAPFQKASENVMKKRRIVRPLLPGAWLNDAAAAAVVAAINDNSTTTNTSATNTTEHIAAAADDASSEATSLFQELNLDDDNALATAHRLGSTRVAKTLHAIALEEDEEDSSDDKEPVVDQVGDPGIVVAAINDNSTNTSATNTTEHIAAAADDASSEAISLFQELNNDDDDALANSHRLGFTRVAKMFDVGLYFGTITSTRWVVDEDGKEFKVCHVNYDDDSDDEDYDKEDYGNARRLYKENEKADPKNRSVVLTPPTQSIPEDNSTRELKSGNVTMDGISTTTNTRNNWVWVLKSVQYTKNGANQWYSVVPMARDGNCLFLSLAYQLQDKGIDHRDATYLRQEIVQHMLDNLEDFRESIPLCNHQGVEDFVSAEAYLNNMKKSGVYGDHIELSVFAKLYDFKVRVLNQDGEDYCHDIPCASNNGTMITVLYTGTIDQHYEAAIELSDSGAPNSSVLQTFKYTNGPSPPNTVVEFIKYSNKEICQRDDLIELQKAKYKKHVVKDPAVEAPVVIEDPVVEDQADEEARVEGPAVTEDPVVIEDPLVEDQANEEPSVEGPAVTEDPVVIEDPLVEDQADEEPAVKGPAVTEAPVVIEDPLVEDQANEEPAVKGPAVTEAPVVIEDPLVEDQADEEPAVKGPAVTEAPVVIEDPLVEDQADEDPTVEAPVVTVDPVVIEDNGRTNDVELNNSDFLLYDDGGGDRMRF
ncbi:hypothetical protein FRACYDRAFT_255488 [Fragilariopsis cylindrus CCMP1102]|uniref:OTU domain-containing protein n=1 Tax=Fragilariopsis cylindrus CCMP1102 TaxID=635003 RepID=A0A1E7EK59_9STRA|nr:hypothetical protein FRACYDRAFT_255488 [Fragilariopsis cylindrus CCMP1102]|eukprot:OEU06257.1 hypothetical protein FRACYDRAFT_255488 [Fragilariopsis cylindrus CCMP1102]